MNLGIAFDDSATSMCVLESDGRVVAVNASMCRLLGRARSEILQSNWTDFTHSADVSLAAKLIEETATGRSPRSDFDCRIVQRDVSMLWCRTSATLLRTVMPAARPCVLLEVVDTTTEYELTERNRTAEERIQLAITAAQDAFVGMGADGTITEWNQAAETMFGWSSEEVIGRSLASTIIPEDQRAAHARGLARYLASGEGPVLKRKVEVKALRRDGVEFLVELTIWPVVGVAGVAFNAFLRDVSERLRFQEELRRLAIAATTDQGTGLKNRRGFFALAQHELNVAARLGHTLTLIFFDLDHLKEINDTRGHLEGDRAIADTAHILTSTFRESDLVARLGGDEFCVLALGPREGFAKTIRRLQEAIDDHNTSAQRSYELSLSFGVAFFDPGKGPVSLDELMSKADASMYEAKVRSRSA